MRFASLALTALLALAAAPAMANGYDYYKLASSPDASHNLYLRHDYAPDEAYPGSIMIFMLQTRAGPGVQNGVFATHIGGNVRCDDDTMSINDHLQYDRNGRFLAGDDLDGADPDFKPVDMDGQYGLVIKIVCGQQDPTVFPDNTNVTIDELIEADIAAYDVQNGGTYAY